MTLLRLLRGSLAVAATVAIAACSSDNGTEVVEEPGPGPVSDGDGALVVDWTISGTKDPAQCQQGSASTIDVIVDGPGGGEFRQSCDAFATTITLPPGTYTANAVLLDPDGNERTTEVPIDAFTIEGGDQWTAAIDFPADSFRLAVAAPGRSAPAGAPLVSPVR